MSTTLWVTHLTVFLLGAGCGGRVVYTTMRARASRRAGDTMTGQNKERSKTALALIGMAVILVVFGLQVRDSNEQDKRDKVRARADHAQTVKFQKQQACLNQFSIDVGQYLTNTLNSRVQANKKLDRAQKALTKAGGALSRANTAVVLSVAGGIVDVPPTADRDDLVTALGQYRRAAAILDRASVAYAKAERETKATLGNTGTASKPYDPPKVNCGP